MITCRVCASGGRLTRPWGSPTLLTARSLIAQAPERCPLNVVPSTHPRQRRKQDRPQELLDAALTLFVEKGFGATRSDEVAALAGVSKGTLYRYYPSKDELFKAVVRESLSARIAEATEWVAGHSGGSAELLCLLMTEWWQRVGQGTAGGISKIMLAEARQFPELARFYVDEVVTPTHRLLGGLIARGVASGEFGPVPVAETVHVLISPMLHMMLYEHSFGACGIHAPSIDPAAVLAVQMDLMLRGLLTAPDATRPPADAGIAAASAVDVATAVLPSSISPLKDPTS